jgi:hypothetical protein
VDELSLALLTLALPLSSTAGFTSNAPAPLPQAVSGTACRADDSAQRTKFARRVGVFAQEDAEIARFDRKNDHWFRSSMAPHAGESTAVADLITNTNM